LQSLAGEQILTGISWALDQRAVAAVIGPSGSGKSRLLRLLNRLDEPTGGQVRMLGRALDEWVPRELRAAVGWVPQRPALSAGTGRDNLELPRRLGLVDAETFGERCERAVEVAGASEQMLARSVTKLSGGERQRIAVARALVLSPRVLLLDEPTSSLDGAGAAALLARLRAWAADAGATLVVVTHRLVDVRALAGELLMLDGGRVVRSGNAEQLLDGADGDRIRALMAGDG